ncbi:unnamed protein product [Jaminaea pallidilutea]
MQERLPVALATSLLKREYDEGIDDGPGEDFTKMFPSDEPFLDLKAPWIFEPGPQRPSARHWTRKLSLDNSVQLVERARAGGVTVTSLAHAAFVFYLALDCAEWPIQRDVRAEASQACHRSFN